MKTYKIRVELELKTASDSEARRLTEIFLKELPRMENLANTKNSIYNNTDHRMVDEDVR